MDGSLMDEVLLALPFILWLQSAAMPLRHPLSRVPLSLQPPHFVAVAGYAALPIGRMAPRKNPSVDFPEDRRFALQISGPLSRASMRSLLIGKKGKNMPVKKNPSLDFFWIAEAKGFCMLLTRHPWLDIPWQETNPFPALAAQRQAARRREHFPKKDIC